MKTKILFTIFIVCLLFSLVTISYSDSNPSGSPTVIRAVGDDKVTEYNHGQKIFFADGLYWVFYAEVNYLRYVTSEDGLTWSEPTNFRTGEISGAGMRLALTYDGTYIHYAYSKYPAGGIYYRMGVFNNVTSAVDWVTTEQNAVSSVSGIMYYCSITTDSSGYPFIGFCTYISATHYANVTKSSTKNGTWTTEFNTELVSGTFSATDRYSATEVRQLTNDRVYCVYTKPDSYVFGKLWNSTDWCSEQQISDSTMYYSRYNSVSEGDDMHIAFQKDDGNGVHGAGRLMYVKGTYSAGTHSWSSETLIDDSPTTWCYPTITRDESDLYVVWQNYPITNHIFYKKFDGVSWGSRVDWVRSTYPSSYTSKSLNLFHNDMDNKIGVFWQSLSDSQYYLEFSNLLVEVNGVGDVSSILNEIMPTIITLAVMAMMLSMLEKFGKGFEGKGD